MGRLLVMLNMAFLMAGVGLAAADIYRWEDDQGVVHFTDNAAKIPAKYRNKVEQRESGPVVSPPPRAAEASPPTATPQAGRAPAVEQLYNGQTAASWKERFVSLRQSLAGAKETLTEKQAALQRAHRAYLVSLDTSRIKVDKDKEDLPKNFALNSIGARRKAYHDLQEEVPKIEEQVRELEAQLVSLTAEADAAGVPSDGR